VFRASTIVVPLTVTVVDQRGTPVKDLTAADFTVTENRKVREIVNFFPQELAAGPVPPGDVAPARVKEAGVKPQTQRTLLIVLGYGRIEHPTNALEGAIDLVNRLLPQDAVAVMAFHRTTVFTRDHQRIAQVLERYRKAHEDIVGEIDNYRFMARAPVYGGLAPPGNAPIPDKFLKRIDEIFLGPLPAGGPTPESSFIRNTADLLLGMDRVVPVIEKPGQHQETFGSITKILGDSGESVTDEVLLNTKLKLYAGVEYLRGFDGEKQMVFFSGLGGAGTLGGSAYRPDGRGGTVMHAGNSDSRVGARIESANIANGVSNGGMARDADEAAVIAQRASDARVVVNQIATNGTGPRISGDPAGREVAELTGGYYTSLEMATKAVAKIDELTRFSYLLGYTPSNPVLDGTFRDVQVTVNRPGVTVRFRHGYFAAPSPPPLELETLMKKARVEAALAYDQQAKDIPLTVTVSQLPRMGLQSETRVEIVIDAGPLALSLKDGVRTGQLEVQVYCGDAKQVVVGDAGQHYDLSIPEATYQQWLQTGIRRTIRVPTDAPAKFVKVVVYDYGSDRIGSAMTTIK
jgi:VWFA-related protein